MKNKILLGTVIVLVAIQCCFCGTKNIHEEQKSIVTTSISTTTTTPISSAVSIVTTTVPVTTTETVIDTTIITTTESETTSISTKETEPVTEATTIITEPVTEKSNPEPVVFVYKPSTHYVHLSNCRWANNECFEINDTHDFDVRLCDECNPDIEVISEYTEPIPEPSSSYVTDYEYMLLEKIVCCEYGGMPSVSERAKIVASVINQTKRWGCTIEEALYNSCVPWGFNPYQEYYCGYHYTEMADAVDYYFAHQYDEFLYWNCDSWYGDGTYNHFYYA